MYQLLTGADVTDEQPLSKTVGVHGRLGHHGGIVNVTLVKDRGDTAEVLVSGSLQAITHWLFLGFGNVNEVAIEIDAATRDGRLQELN